MEQYTEDMFLTQKVQVMFDEKYYKLCTLTRQYVVALIEDVFDSVNISKVVEESFISEKEIIHKLKLSEMSKKCLRWFFRYLGNNGIAATKIKDNIFYYRFCKKFPSVEKGLIRNQLIEIDTQVDISCALLSKAASGYADFLKGTRTGAQILFIDDRMSLWSEYFSNNNAGYKIHNMLGAVGVLKWVHNDKVTILELGGGTGYASIALLSEFANSDKLKNIENYFFSDFSSLFIRSGAREIDSNMPTFKKLKTCKIDFDKPLLDQDVQSNSIDICYGVNSLHVAKNLEKSLGFIYEILKPKGKLIISECVRPNVDVQLFQELIFNLLDNYRDVELSSSRQTPGFLTIDNWEKSFKKAGFTKFEFIDNTCNGDLRNKEDILAAVMKGEK